MQPNLKSLNAISLEFSATVPLSNEQISKIRDVSHPDKDGDSIFFDSYEGHRSLAIVKGANKDTKEYEVEFAYEARSQRRLPKRLSRVMQLVETLFLVKEKLNFECTVSFTFGRRLHAKSIINLPNKYIEAPNMPFDRIQGLHLVKLDGNEIKYDVFLEAAAQGVLFENIIFKHTSSFNESLPEKILQEAEIISDRVVFKESKDA